MEISVTSETSFDVADERVAAAAAQGFDLDAIELALFAFSHYDESSPIWSSEHGQRYSRCLQIIGVAH